MLVKYCTTALELYFSQMARFGLKMYIFLKLEFIPYFKIYLLTTSVNVKYYL